MSNRNRNRLVTHRAILDAMAREFAAIEPQASASAARRLETARAMLRDVDHLLAGALGHPVDVVVVDLVPTIVTEHARP